MTLERKVVRIILTIGLIISFLFILGCHGSGQMERQDTITQAPPPAEVNQRSLNVLLLKDCKEENDSLTRTISKLQQDLRSATARAAEMETQVAELKYPPAPPPGEEKKPVFKAPPPEPKKLAEKVPANERKRPAIKAPPIEESTSAVSPPSSSDGISAYEEGLSLFRSKNFHDALERFESVSSDGGEMAERGTYWSGECRYALKDYNGALASFKKVLGFRNSTKKDDAQMMIGNCYMVLGNRSQAKAEFQKLISDFPASPYVQRARTKINGL